MKTIIELGKNNRAARVTLVLDPGETLANALGEVSGRDWVHEAEELALVAEGLGDDPLQDHKVLQDRVKRGDLVLTRRSYDEQDAIEADQFVRRLGAKHFGEWETRPRAPRSRPPHPDAESLRSPPIDGSSILKDLEKQGRAASSTEKKKFSLRGFLEGLKKQVPPAPKSPPATKPEGPLAPYLGAQYGLDDLIGDITEPEEAACVLAWPVPTLVGRVLVAANVDGFASAIRAMLVDALGDLPFAVSSHNYGGVGKYMHLHTSVVAPPMGGQPMAIELYGSLVAAGNYDFRTREAGRFLLLRERLLQSENFGDSPDTDGFRRQMDLVHGHDLPEPLVVVLQSATYANVLYPGPGVPFYM